VIWGYRVQWLSFFQEQTALDQGDTALSESVRAVERALDVLLCFTSQTPELTMTQIADRIGINKSTVHRLLGTLERRRFVQRDPATGAYQLGIRLFQMAYLTLEHNDLRRLAAPFLRRLCEQYQENVDLSVLDDMDVIFINHLEGPQRVKVASATGQRLPAFSTASGRATLAYLPDEATRGILARGISSYTPYTPRSEEAVLEDLCLIRERGFALSEQEYEEGINAVAAPILDGSNRPFAAVAIVGPAYRLTRERMIEIGPTLVTAASEIAQELAMIAHAQALRT
jgi:DNA-binding IclR family transcriptional regulator